MAKSTNTSKASPGRSIPSKVTQWGLIHDQRCMAALDIEGKGPDLLQVATCLNKQYPLLAPHLQPMYDRGSLLVQVLRDFPSQSDLHAQFLSLKSSGLRIGNRQAVFRPLYWKRSATGKNVMEFRLEGVRVVEDVRNQLGKSFAKWGKILDYQFLQHAGTKVPTGEARIVLDLGDQEFVPSRTLSQPGVGNKFTCYPVNATFCKLCRSRQHSRDTCMAAPQCSKCSSLQHSAQHCTAKAPAKPTSPPKPAAEATTNLHNSTPTKFTIPSIKLNFALPPLVEQIPVKKPQPVQSKRDVDTFFSILNSTKPAPVGQSPAEQPSSGPASGIQSMQMDRGSSDPGVGRNDDDHRSKRLRDKSRSPSPNS